MSLNFAEAASESILEVNRTPAKLKRYAPFKQRPTTVSSKSNETNESLDSDESEMSIETVSVDYSIGSPGSDGEIASSSESSSSAGECRSHCQPRQGPESDSNDSSPDSLVRNVDRKLLRSPVTSTGQDDDYAEQEGCFPDDGASDANSRGSYVSMDAVEGIFSVPGCVVLYSHKEGFRKIPMFIVKRGRKN